MTLLANRAKTTASDNDATRKNGRQNGRAATGRKISFLSTPTALEAASVIAPPEEALRTLQARLQAQVNNREESSDESWDGSDPGARFIVHSVHRRLNQVTAALERIEEGKYGVCTDCQEPIENDRLVLQPMSTRCTRCQAIAEWRGTAY